MQPYLPYGWQKTGRLAAALLCKGQVLQIFACNQHKRLNLLGLMSLDNRLTVYPSEQSLTGTFVVKALEDFLAKPHSKPVVIVLDNGPIHRCQAVYQQQAQWEEKGAYLFFLPTYSPHLNPSEGTLRSNPIEILWRFIKYRWLNKPNYDSWTKLKAAITQVIADFGSIYKINFQELIHKNVLFNSA
ncbi:MAG: transposase [Ferruginibacter sp.]|nr:transposase [Cytophagales bacterium]